MGSDLSSKENKKYSTQLFTIAVVSLAVVLVAFFFVRDWENKNLLKEFNFSADSYQRILESRLRDIRIELDSTKRFFQGSEFVERDEFIYFTDETIAASEEVKGVIWAPRVLGKERGSFESSKWMQGYFISDHTSFDPDPSLHEDIPAMVRVIHFPILFAQPYEKFLPSIGFDLASNPEVLSQLEQARDEGIVVPITGRPVHYLMIDGDEDNLRSNINLVQPVYQTTEPLATIRQRREKHRGFIMLQFNIGKALENSLSGIPPRGFDIYIVDVEADDGSEVVFHHYSRLNQDRQELSFSELWNTPDFIHKSALDISGRQWKVVMVPDPSYFEINRQYQSWGVLIFGLILSTILFYLFLMNHRKTDEIRAIVKTRTRELKNSETNQRAVIENIAEGLVTINTQGIIETFNPTAEKMFGYSSAEAIGKNVSMLMPLDERNAHNNYIKNSRITNSRIINTARDLYGLHKNGTQFQMELNISPMNIDGGSKFVGIMHDITERKETANILLAAKEEAETANRAKSEFLSSMSHELRTPMNAIMGFAQMLEMNSEEPLSDEQKQSVDHITRGGNYLLELIDQVLELNRIEAGKLSINIDHVSTGEIIDECLYLIQGRADKEGIKILDQVDRNQLPILWTDKTRAIQALLNLMSNAVKYNRKDGTVTLDCKEIPNQMLRISVVDTGKGIPVEKQADLFKPFERLGRESGEIEGTGIGLSITKQIIELLDGRVGYESIEGKGSTFWIDIPLSSQQAESQRQTNTVARPDHNTKQQKDEAARTILYVEDNPDNLRLMESIIGQFTNIRMLSAYSAEVGLDLAINEKPDLVLMDINLPGMSGIEALKQLQKAVETKHIPVIAITAAAMPGDVEAGMKAGFRTYFTKPINIPKLLRVLEEILGSTNSVD